MEDIAYPVVMQGSVLIYTVQDKRLAKNDSTVLLTVDAPQNIYSGPVNSYWPCAQPLVTDSFVCSQVVSEGVKTEGIRVLNGRKVVSLDVLMHKLGTSLADSLL